MPQKTIAIIGGGAAALAAADVLSKHFEVHIYEKGKALGRKFLVAGNGGFNLTNSATGEALYHKYTPVEFLQPALKAFDSDATRNWLSGLGISTFTGSSGRVFPEKGIKPITVLQSLKNQLLQNGVQFHFQHTFNGFNSENRPIVKHAGNEIIIQADHCIFALGGASWPVTGSDGNWLTAFGSFGVKTIPFQSSNCGINVNWPVGFAEKFAGQPLKNIRLSINNFCINGEALITAYGLEGNVIYPVVPEIRNVLQTNQTPLLSIDFKPQNSKEQLLDKIKSKNIQTKNYEHFFKLSKAQIALIKAFSTKDNYVNPELFVHQIKQLQVPVTSLRSVEEAISTVGGIALEEVNPDFSLKKFPHISVIGEMLDWDAPTGGFLLQGCFSSAYFAANVLKEKLQTL